MVELLLAPSPLLAATGGKRQFSVEGTTVAEAVRSLCAQNSGLERFIHTGDGRIRHYVKVFVNGTSVRDLAGEDTPVGPSDTITIFMVLAGG